MLARKNRLSRLRVVTKLRRSKKRPHIGVLSTRATAGITSMRIAIVVLVAFTPNFGLAKYSMRTGRAIRLPKPRSIQQPRMKPKKRSFQIRLKLCQGFPILLRERGLLGILAQATAEMPQATTMMAKIQW